MGPKQPGPKSADLFRQPLIEQINAKHPLVRPFVVARALMARVRREPCARLQTRPRQAARSRPTGAAPQEL